MKILSLSIACLLFLNVSPAAALDINAATTNLQKQGEALKVKAEEKKPEAEVAVQNAKVAKKQAKDKLHEIKSKKK